MNKKELSKMKGKKIRIRPVPIKMFNGSPEEVDDIWFVEKASKELLEISNTSRGYSKEIGTDHIKEFRTDPQFGIDGFLFLRAQLKMNGRALDVEPFREKYYETKKVP